MSRSDRLKTRLKKAVFGVLGGVLTAAITAEIGVRMLGANGILPNRMPADIFAAHPIGWALEPDLHARIMSTGGLIDIRVNKDGFRDKTYPQQRGDGQNRILVLGDSFTLALETPQQDVFHSLLEDEYQGTAEVISMGVSGYGPLQEYLAYQDVGRAYDPDVVLVMFYVGNDVLDNRSWPGLPVYSLETDGSLTLHNYPYQGSFHLPLVASQRSSYLMRHSMLAFIIGSIVRNNRQESKVEDYECGYLISENYPNPNEDDWRLTEAILLAMRDAVEADGKIFRVAIIPMEMQVEQSLQDHFDANCTVPAWAQQLQPRLDTFFEANHIAYLDLLDPLLKARQQSTEPLYLPNEDIHWSHEGHAAVASLLYDWLNE